MTRTEKFIADVAQEKAGDVHVRVDYSLPAGSMIVSPDVFSRIDELARMDRMDAFYAEETKWLRGPL
jgi:hypothetical protein